MSSEIESAALAFNDLAQGGSSDKVYYLSLTQNGDAFTVTGQCGRRGSALMSQVKARNVSESEARKTFDKVLRSKLSGGYVRQGQAPGVQVAPSGVTVDIKPPELLDEVVNGDHVDYVNDPAYWMQDKSDGVSRGVVKQAGEIFGINKRGVTTPLPVELVTELSAIQLDAFQIDAELVGTKLVCRDLLVANEDISAKPYRERFTRLESLITGFTLISVVETWREHADKTARLPEARKERREGVVFKLISAPYRAGRSGQHKKYKFIKTLSAIAGKPRANGKESVEVFLIDGESLVRCGTVSLIGKPAISEGDIVEVAYLYAYPSKLMVQARLLNVRTDVTREECVTSQLIMKRDEEKEAQ